MRRRSLTLAPSAGSRPAERSSGRKRCSRSWRWTGRPRSMWCACASTPKTAWLSMQSSAIRCGSSAPEYVGAMHDVTEMKKSQEALQRTQLALADLTKVASLGEMAAAIAHEVNQPLAGIGLNANTCLRWLREGQLNAEEARGAASRIARDAQRAGDVIKRLRALFNRTSPTRAPMDLNEAVREILAVARTQVQRSGALIVTDLAEDAPLVQGDRVQLQQVIVNLVLNGAESMIDVHDRPREIRLRTRAESGHVRVDVSDVGVGIAPEQADHIFKPFHTTKSGGMGMGLSICKTIVESHGGSLRVTKNAGPGSTFSFSIPTPDGAE